jgi:hypothetical protein
LEYYFSDYLQEEQDKKLDQDFKAF